MSISADRDGAVSCSSLGDVHRGCEAVGSLNGTASRAVGRCALCHNGLMLRRLGCVIVLGLCVGITVACGGGRSDRMAATEGPRGAESEAISLVDAVNLHASDVPGFKAIPEDADKTAPEGRVERAIESCLGTSRGLAERSSATYGRDADGRTESISSEVSVAQTAAVAEKEFDETRTGRTRTCLSHYLGILFRLQAHRGVTVGSIAIFPGRPPARGITGSFAWRIVTSLRRHTIRVPFYLDIFGFVYGRAEVALFDSGTPVPFEATAEQHFFWLLLSRASRGRVNGAEVTSKAA
jgi:hypothetical protein